LKDPRIGKNRILKIPQKTKKRGKVMDKCCKISFWVEIFFALTLTLLEGINVCQIAMGNHGAFKIFVVFFSAIVIAFSVYTLHKTLKLTYEMGVCDGQTKELLETFSQRQQENGKD
jgi:hypothetical protein